MIDDEVQVKQFVTLLYSKSKKEFIERIAEIGQEAALKEPSCKKIHCEITHVIRESDGWIRNIHIRREDSNKDDPFEKLIRCVRMTDEIWYSEDGLVILKPVDQVDLAKFEDKPVFKFISEPRLY